MTSFTKRMEIRRIRRISLWLIIGENHAYLQHQSYAVRVGDDRISKFVLVFVFLRAGYLLWSVMIPAGIINMGH